MTTVLPSGYATWAATYRQSATGRAAVVTLGVLHTPIATAAGTRANINNAFFSTGGLLDPITLDTSWIIEGTYVLSNQGGVLTSDTVLVGLPGSDTHTSPPPNVSVLMNKRSALAGRQNRGKMSIPAGFIDETDIDEGGVIAGATQIALQAAALQSFNALVANNVPPYLLHSMPISGILPLPTAVTSFFINPLVGTQRKRLRR